MTDRPLDDLAVLTLQSQFGGGYWYSAVINKLARIESDKIDTMGVCFNTNGSPILLYNPKFLKKLTNLEAANVLLHEALHIFFRHVTRHFTLSNHQRSNIADDITINQHLKFLPDKTCRCHYPQDYGFPLDLTSEAYYDLLKKKEEEEKKGQKQKQKGGKSGGGQGQGEQDKDSNEGDDEGDGKSDLDDHSLWGKVLDENGNLVDAEDMGVDTSTAVDVMIKEVIEQCKNKGSAPNFIQAVIDELTKVPTFDWKRELKLYIQSALSPKKRLSQKRVNRRFMNFDYILPGKKKARQASVLVVRDTSGSMWSKEVQEALMVEVLSISSRATVQLIDCDTEVHGEPIKVRKLEDIKEFQGGGGTSFVEPFKVAKKLNVDVVIYMTDLYGDFPDPREIGRYNYNTIWCVWKENYDDSHKPPFGKVVVVDLDQNK